MNFDLILTLCPKYQGCHLIKPFPTNKVYDAILARIHDDEVPAVAGGPAVAEAWQRARDAEMANELQ